jgi:hypothetical protein
MTTTTAQQQLGIFLEHAAEGLDLPDSIRDEARKKYQQIGEWLKDDHEQQYASDAEIYVQGSTRLGTGIRPVKDEDEYDIDLVYRRDIKKQSITQDDLKTQVGDQLYRYIRYLKQKKEQAPTLIEGSRCWTLDYPGKFHMDILPALPDDEPYLQNTRDYDDAIIITDKDLRTWKYSNPKGYSNWFHEQMHMAFREQREFMAKAASVDVEDILEQDVKTTLQRSVQLLKRHRDIRYQGNPDDKPVSIIITTLAAHAYQNQADFYEAFISIVKGMKDYIEVRNGKYWVGNPVNPNGENFADKWETEPQRKERFFQWLSQVESDIEQALRQQGLGIDKVAGSLNPVFGDMLIKSATKRYGDALLKQRRAGNLKVTLGTGMLGYTGARPVRPHTEYGD